MYVTCKDRKIERIAALEVYDEVLVYAKMCVYFFKTFYYFLLGGFSVLFINLFIIL